MEYAVEIGSSDIIYTPSFRYIGSGVQKMMGVIQIQAAR
jgi:hypothetical protein